MPSPFPGMDPWLESPRVFPDLHSTFVTFLRGELNRRLPPPFRAAIATRIYMEESERRIEPDIDVLTPINGWTGSSVRGAATSESVATLLEVPTQPLPSDEITETSIEVRTSDGSRRLVMSIEVLSPSNKTCGSNGRALYLAKQLELRSAGVNLVEIDLLRRGVHTTAVSSAEHRRLYGRCDYHICYTRIERDNATFVVPIMLPQRLPVIPIPLTSDVPDAVADLQAVFERCYEDARYDLEVNYTTDCDPPLTPEQQAWAEGVLREKGIFK